MAKNNPIISINDKKNPQPPPINDKKTTQLYIFQITLVLGGKK